MVYKPGVENVAADVLSHFGQHVEQELDVSIGKYSLADMDVALAVCAWLHMVAQHVCFDKCIAAAMVTLLMGLPMASFGYCKCSATHLNADKFVQKLHMCHICSLCNHHWIKQPAVLGNPLAALGC